MELDDASNGTFDLEEFIECDISDYGLVKFEISNCFSIYIFRVIDGQDVKDYEKRFLKKIDEMVAWK